MSETKNIRDHIWLTNGVKWQADIARKCMAESVESLIVILENVSKNNP